MATGIRGSNLQVNAEIVKWESLFSVAHETAHPLNGVKKKFALPQWQWELGVSAVGPWPRVGKKKS